MDNLLTLLQKLEESNCPSSQYLPDDNELVSQIEGLACQLLIEGGQCAWSNIDVLEDSGYHVKCLSRDRFGWLMGGIVTKKGIVRYG